MGDMPYLSSSLLISFQMYFFDSSSALIQVEADCCVYFFSFLDLLLMMPYSSSMSIFSNSSTISSSSIQLSSSSFYSSSNSSSIRTPFESQSLPFQSAHPPCSSYSKRKSFPSSLNPIAIPFESNCSTKFSQRGSGLRLVYIDLIKCSIKKNILKIEKDICLINKFQNDQYSVYM